MTISQPNRDALALDQASAQLEAAHDLTIDERDEQQLLAAASVASSSISIVSFSLGEFRLPARSYDDEEGVEIVADKMGTLWMPLRSELDKSITASRIHLLAYFRHLFHVQLEDLSVHYDLFLIITHALQP